MMERRIPLVEMIRMKLLNGIYGVARLDSGMEIPDWAKGEFTSITSTPDELSVTCSEEYIPEKVRCESGWRVLKVIGPLDFSLVGILSRISGIMAKEGISIFAISTFDTDYILVKDEKIEAAVNALKAEGFEVS